MKFDKNHPKLTAYALGELNEKETKQVEKLLEQYPELKQEVEAIQALTANLTEELKSESKLHLSERRRVQLEQQFKKNRGWKLNWNQFTIMFVPVAAALVAFIYYQKGTSLRQSEEAAFMDNQAIPERVIEKPSQGGLESADEEDVASLAKEEAKSDPEPARQQAAPRELQEKRKRRAEPKAPPPAALAKKQKQPSTKSALPKKDKDADGWMRDDSARPAERPDFKRPGPVTAQKPKPKAKARNAPAAAAAAAPAASADDSIAAKSKSAPAGVKGVEGPKNKKASGVNLSKLGLGAGKVVNKEGPGSVRSNFKNAAGGAGGGSGSASKTYGLGGADKKNSLELSGSGGAVNNFGSGGGALGSGGRGRNNQKGGALRGRPTVETPSSESSVSDGLTRNEVMAVIRANLNQIRHCYELLLQRAPNAGGKVNVKWIIGSNGRVTSATTTGGTITDKRIRSCITGKIRRWKFPKPRGVPQTTVRYPFNFTPLGSETGKKNESERRPQVTLFQYEVTTSGGLTRQEIIAVTRGNLNQIRACYENVMARAPNTAGRIVVKYQINAGGRVSTIERTGSDISDEVMNNCVVGKIKNWRFPKPRGSSFVTVEFPFGFSLN